MLNFCRRKRSFQWCPDQSDRSNGARDIHKNFQKVEWKTQSKISCHYTWLLRGQICLSHGAFLRSFLTASKPSRRLITAAKRKGKEKEEKKKNSKIDFCSCLSPNVVKRDGSGKKGKLLCCKCQSLDQIKANLAEIQPENHQNVQKTHFWQKAPGSNGLMKSLYLWIWNFLGVRGTKWKDHGNSRGWGSNVKPSEMENPG